MTNQSKPINFIKFAIIFLTFSLPVQSHAKTYTIGYSPGSLYHAIVRDRMKLVYDRAGLPVKFIGIPHKRSVASANSGETDGDAGRNPNVEKKFKNLIRVSPMVSESLGSAYTTNPSILHYHLKDLKNYKVGYVSGVRWVTKKLAGIEATTVRTYPQLIKMLISGRIDIAVGTDLSMDKAIKDLNNNFIKIKQLSPKANRSPTFHYVNKKNADIVPKLEKAIKELIAEKAW